jgi:hypothetical protein
MSHKRSKIGYRRQSKDSPRSNKKLNGFLLEYPVMGPLAWEGEKEW